MKPRIQCVQTHWNAGFMASKTATESLMMNVS